MVTDEHAAGALDGSVDPEELTTLLAQENQDLRAEIERLQAENAELLSVLQEANHCLVACLTGGEVSAARAGKAIEAAAAAIAQAMTKP